MFSVQQKREIADAVQKILRATNHPELPKTGEIRFKLHVDGAEKWSWADIVNNGAVSVPGINPWNEMQDDEDDNRVPLDEYMDDEYCVDCGKPSHAIMNGLCPMCFELTGGVGHNSGGRP